MRQFVFENNFRWN